MSIVRCDLSDDVHAALMHGAGTLFQARPFWAALILNPKLRIGQLNLDVVGPDNPTAATDGKRSIGLHEPFLRNVVRKAAAAGKRSTLAGVVTYVVLHELAHILMDDANPITCGRMPDDDIRGRAVDYRVFELLRADNLLPPAAFVPYTLDDALVRAAPAPTLTAVCGDHNLAATIPDHADVVAIYRWLERNTSRGGGSVGSISLTGDAVHQPGGGEGQQGGPAAGSELPGAVAPGRLTPGKSDDVIRQELMAEALAASQMIGCMSVTAARVADALFVTRIPWDQQLANVLRRRMSDAGTRMRTFRRLGRRTYTGMQPGAHVAVAYPSYLPGPTLDLVCAVDVSGSIDNVTLSRFGGVLTDLLEARCVGRVRVVYCSTETEDGGTFTRGSPVELRTNITGGTDFEPVWAWQREHAPDAGAIVYLTDMLGSFGPASSWPAVPVVWVSTSRGVKAPFGDVIEVT